MKRLLKFGLIGLLVLLVGAFVLLTFAVNKSVKRGVEFVAPKITQTDVKLDDVNLSLLSGGGSLQGFVVGSPEGYKAASSMSVGEVHVSVDVKSLLSDKYVVRSIRVIEPEITFEGGLQKNNLNKILENVQAATGGGGEKPGRPPETKDQEENPAQHKIQVNEFVLSGAKVKWAVPGLAGRTIDIVLPTMEMRDLGTGEDGITVAELVQKVLAAVTKNVVKVLGENAADLGGDAVEALKGLSPGSVEDATKTIKDLGNLFKKKQD